MNAYQAPAVVEVGPAHAGIRGWKLPLFFYFDSELWADYADRFFDIDETDE